jgi:hypothetical protein
MHCAAPTVHLSWSVWGVDSRGFILECGWFDGAAIPLSQVVVKVSDCVWYLGDEPVVIIVIVIICD